MLEQELHKRVIGQAPAIEAVSDAVRRARAGLQDEDRPIGSFMFLGSTGVGKTELARSLADFLFNDEDAMIRIEDRKSTRLNSSHVAISYAVFCLKKKKQN